MRGSETEQNEAGCLRWSHRAVFARTLKNGIVGGVFIEIAERWIIEAGAIEQVGAGFREQFQAWRKRLFSETFFRRDNRVSTKNGERHCFLRAPVTAVRDARARSFQMRHEPACPIRNFLRAGCPLDWGKPKRTPERLACEHLQIRVEIVTIFRLAAACTRLGSDSVSGRA